ncbi:MAG: putative CoA-binding protein [Rhodobacteraceae bacterium HLUCCA08]|nr:MAG: putative CoA-binding protein [Rhodobacteraceae bacterium HLUCCA08]
MSTDDDQIRDILTAARVIALVGFSANPDRPSHGVARFLQDRGYRVIPVNPGLAGQVHLGEPVRASVDDIPDAVDMVDIFRRSDAVGGIVDRSLARWPDLQAMWMQLGVVDADAAGRARAAGVRVVMDRCPKIEIARLGLAGPGARPPRA